jgi:methyl-accepting chemotaxis protein
LLVETAVAKTRVSQTKVHEVTTAMRTITEASAQTKELLAEIGQGSKEQSAGIAAISRAVAAMEGVTQTNAASVERSAASAQELMSQTVAMRQVVDRLTELS